MSFKVSVNLPSTLGERLIAAVASPFLVLLGTLGVVGTHRTFGRGGDDWRSQMLDFFFKVALQDVCLGIALFGLVLFIWAVSRFWIAERILLYFANDVWRALIVFGGGFVVCCAAAYAIGP